MIPFRTTTYLLALLVVCCFTQSFAKFHRHDGSFEPDYVLVATAENVTIDCQTRYSVVINGTYPGPVVYMKEGVTTWVRVRNNIEDQNFTMHWHGLTQRTAPFSDGTPLVSQWPIKPGEFFDYEIHPDVGDAGTYFYHSHVGFQQITAHGTLVVLDANEPPYTYDHERYLTFSDFYPANDSTIEHGLLGSPFKWSGEPNAIAIEGSSGTAPFTDEANSTCAPHLIEVHAGKSYRFRVVGKTALSLVKFAIEDHDNLTVIEADGHYTEPVETDHMQVGPGQRFSFLFTAKSEEELIAANKTMFWLRYESRERPTIVTGYALVRYKTSGGAPCPPLPAALPDRSPVVLPNNTYNWLEYAFSPLNSSSMTDTFPKLSEVTRTVYITLNQVGTYMNKTFTDTVVWAQNNNDWQEGVQDDYSRPPYLINAFLTGTTPNYTAALENQGYDPLTQAWPAQVGEVLDIVWLSNSGPSGGFDFHPMHAHGEHYWDLGSGNGTYNATQNEADHFSNDRIPAQRDTTILYRYTTSSTAFKTQGWRAWRIRVTENNVGAWMMHCHIAQHAVMGMNTIWVFGNASSIVSQFPTLPYLGGYLEYGGSAYGNDSFDPMVNHYFEDQ